MKKLNVLLPILMIFLANCSLDIAIEDVGANDFAKSSILSTTRGVGDGVTGAIVVVLLKNTNGTIVVGHLPEFDFLDESGLSFEGEGITFSDCTRSNGEGISTCIIKSIVVGSKKLAFNNVMIELAGDIFFDPPARNGTFTQIVASAQVKQDAEGYSVTSHTGTAFSGLRQEASGYTIFTSTTNAITPDE